MYCLCLLDDLQVLVKRIKYLIGKNNKQIKIHDTLLLHTMKPEYNTLSHIPYFINQKLVAKTIFDT